MRNNSATGGAPQPCIFFALCVLTLFCALSFPSVANAVEGGFTMRWGYDFGSSSKKLVRASQLGYPSDGRSITASEGEFYTVGLSAISDSREFVLDAAIGIKSATLCDTYNVSGDWSDLWPTCAPDSQLNVEFSRIPLELIVAYEGIPGLRLGAGLTYLIAPELTVTSPTVNYRILYDNAPGYIAEIAFKTSSRHGDGGFLIGVRRIWLRYEDRGVLVAKANGVGFFVGFSLR